MTISVVVRTFNRPTFLRRALKDIAQQTLLPDEVIVVNDGGDRAAVAKAGEGVDLPLTIIDIPETVGRARAANAGMRAAQSELVTMHDDDDTWAPEFLQKTSVWLAEHADHDALVTKIDIMRDRISQDGSVEMIERFPFGGHLHEVTLFDLLRTNRFTPIGFVYRRSLHDDLGYYDDALPVVEDWDFHMRIAARGPIPILPSEEALAFWHQRPESRGDTGNSVVVDQDAHRRYDLLRRDEALRNDPAGMGGLLYLTRFIDERTHDLHVRFDEQRDQIDRLQVDVREKNERISQLEAAISDSSFVSLVRRRWRRWRHRNR